MNIQETLFILQGNVTQFKISNLELWLSGTAVLISIGSLMWQSYKEEKHHKTNLESSYFNDIYMRYLIKDIPEGRNRIVFNNGHVSGTNNIIDTLNKIRQDSLFFKYKDEVYYKIISNKLQELENLYVEVDMLSTDEFVVFSNKTEEMISDIYQIVTSKYHGNKTKKFKRIFKNNR